MCLLVVASRVQELAPLVVGANRDERLDRPATTIAVLRSAGPRILGGRDELAGGTWLAVNEHGVVAALTNRPAPEGRDPTKRSRGELPLALAMHDSAPQAVERFVAAFHPSDYNPAWLMVGDRNSLFYVDMTTEHSPEARELHPGIHVLENFPLGEPSAKVDHVLELLGPPEDLEQRQSLVTRIGEVLRDHSLPEAALAEAVHGDGRRRAGSPVVAERPVSRLAACVHGEEYGTRSSTLILVPREPGSEISVAVADGAPCSAPFVDASALWETADA